MCIRDSVEDVERTGPCPKYREQERKSSQRAFSTGEETQAAHLLAEWHRLDFHTGSELIRSINKAQSAPTAREEHSEVFLVVASDLLESRRELFDDSLVERADHLAKLGTRRYEIIELG